MKILVIGSGGREHAIVWKVRQSPRVTKLYCAPGNAGIGRLAELVNIKISDLNGLLEFARENGIDCTIVGPEQPLTEGIVDLFESAGLKIFGPSKAAAEIEGSKVFAKQFMKRHKIPTAEFRAFSAAERFDAERYINETPVPIVVKADGLAAGKGVTVCETKEKALEVLDMIMERKIFGAAGSKVVIEEFLVGEEASIFAITDGREYVTLPAAQDHKRILDNDQGKNTGGMGAYAPAPVITRTVLEQIRRTIIRPTLDGLVQEGRPFKGCLYIGVIQTETGPQVIEFNCRFGDPETQVVLPLLDADLVELILGAISGKLPPTVPVKPETTVCVVIASGGYPDDYDTGKQILGLDAAESGNVMLFHAGTKLSRGSYVTSGGRVLGVTASGPGDKPGEAIDTAYRAVEKITFDGAYYRSDIGKKLVDRLRITGNLETA